VNRSQRRAAERAGVPETVIAWAEGYRCPDCASETELHVADGLPVLDVRHDGTCPTYRVMEENR
jgi:hypothetical protein